jgi:hypothetical protein
MQEALSYQHTINACACCGAETCALGVLKFADSAASARNLGPAESGSYYRLSWSQHPAQMNRSMRS